MEEGGKEERGERGGGTSEEEAILLLLFSFRGASGSLPSLQSHIIRLGRWLFPHTTVLSRPHLTLDPPICGPSVHLPAGFLYLSYPFFVTSNWIAPA